MLSLLSTLLMLAVAQLGSLEGYVFRETDGGPPRRPLTVELIDQGRTRYHGTTRSDGAFEFSKVRDGRYTIRARFGDFIIVEDNVTVTSKRKNFAVLMLPKRRVGVQSFRTVTADQLEAQSDRALQKKLRQAFGLVGKGDLAGAAQLYEQAVASGTQPGLWDALGVLYVKMGRTTEAYHAFEKAIEQDPKYLFSYAHLGTAYLEEGQYEDLVRLAKRALAIDPKWLTAYSLLAEGQAGVRNIEGAQQSAQTASELAQGKAPGPYLILSKLRWARRDCAGARKYMDRYLELNTSARDRPEMQKSLEILQACGAAH
ncbi:MAG TPA: tetratricopeptide repeat protein [Terriglobia bacterium]|nr:tetratricopeptide repeat protein [Terriglobia bacterium]